jgi:hypothetical protein
VVVHRKQSPKVRDGRVQKKNNWNRTIYYSQVKGLGFVIDRDRPGKGYRHLLLKDHIERFCGLLPDWDELSEGLDAVILVPGVPGKYGWNQDGLIGINAWPRELHEVVGPKWAAHEAHILERLGVPVVKRGPKVLLAWTEETARAYQLVDVFLHELGHHHDQMTTGGQRRTSRGESYADSYAKRHCDQIWTSYIDEFGLPS